jgi:hypothetical protein
MLYLLSFDIGIKNMAYCFASIDNNNNNNFMIKNIDNINLNCNKNIQNIINNTIEFLDDLMIKLKIDDTNDKLIILIECQMTSIMRTIQTCINTYFKIIGKHLNLDIDTIYVSPKHKLKIMDKFGDKVASSKYKQNKIDSIYYANHLLTTVYKNDEILAIINSHKKKDDLADCFLQLMDFLSKKGLTNIFSKTFLIKVNISHGCEDCFTSKDINLTGVNF